MFRIILFLIAALITTEAAARCTGTDLRNRLTPSYEARLQREIKSVPYAYGNHWVATKGSRTINVIGTMHSGDARMRPVMRTLEPAIAGADLVLLEVTKSQARNLSKKLEEDPGLFLITDGPTLPEMMSSEDWRKLVTQAVHLDFTSEELAHIQPWLLSFMLSTSGCGGRGIASYAGLDDRIERLAKRKRVPVAGLETIEFGFAMLSRQPIRDQLKLLQLDLESDLNFDDQVVTQTEAYFDEELAEAWLVQEWTLYRDTNTSRREVSRLLTQFDDLILDRRNLAWMPVILNAQGNNIVVAVGAAHLPGRNGILNLLKKKGYTLQRAAF